MRSDIDVAARRAAASHRREPIKNAASEHPLSRNQRVVLKELESGVPKRAYELLETLQDEGLRAPMTIYRALSALIERGLVKKVASLNAFVATSGRSGRSAGAFIICKRCGKTAECLLDRRHVDALFATSGVAIDDVYIEAFGDCRRLDCAME